MSLEDLAKSHEGGIASNILSFLDIPSLCKVERTNKALRECAAGCWKTHEQRLFAAPTAPPVPSKANETPKQRVMLHFRTLATVKGFAAAYRSHQQARHGNPGLGSYRSRPDHPVPKTSVLLPDKVTNHDFFVLWQQGSSDDEGDGAFVAVTAQPQEGQYVRLNLALDSIPLPMPMTDRDLHDMELTVVAVDRTSQRKCHFLLNTRVNDRMRGSLAWRNRQDADGSMLLDPLPLQSCRVDCCPTPVAYSFGLSMMQIESSITLDHDGERAELQVW
eukprot:CAMPEP_0198116610 /NCGR_PEP_ID=MMETSP1442-20131203/13535_1 /TAXON_ID= /ORGANISM="Craspedostauros australis, Strain CCMP3328" /LENGTH=274 /DNA_ID=CAMNT_0043774477 /DNA_START=96 /DNA_END=917 /DNA_ORIENTATION=+